MKNYFKTRFVSQFLLKISLRTERNRIAAMLTTAESALAEVNRIIQDTKQNIQAATSALETSPSFGSNVAEQRLLDCKTALAKSNVLLNNILQIQKIVCEQGSLVRQERDAVFSLHNQLLSTIEAKTKASQALRIAELTINNIRNILPSARLQREQVKTATDQVSQYLEEAIRLDKTEYTSELDLLKNDAQCIKNSHIEVSHILNDTEDNITNIKKLIQNVRYQMTTISAAKKLIDAEVAFENANILFNNIVQAHQLIVSEEANVKHMLDSFNTEMLDENSIEINLPLYVDIKIVAKNLQSILPSIEQNWQQIKTLTAQANIHINSGLELQQKFNEQQEKDQKLTIQHTIQSAEKALDNIHQILESTNKQIKETSDLLAATRQEISAPAATQALLQAEAEISTANILIKNILQAQEMVKQESYKIKTIIQDSNQTNHQKPSFSNDVQTAVFNINIKSAAQNIESLLPQVIEQSQKVEHAVEQARLYIKQANELPKVEIEKQKHIEKELALKTLQEVKKIIMNVDAMIAKSKQYIDEMKKLLAKSQKTGLTLMLSNIEAEITTSQILLMNIVQGREMMLAEQAKIETNLNSLKVQNLSSDINLPELYTNIKYAFQNVESLLPTIEEQQQQIKGSAKKCKAYIQTSKDPAERFETSTTGAQTISPNPKKVEYNVDAIVEPTAEIPKELFDELGSSTDIQQLKLKIQQQEEQIEQLLSQLQELEVPLE